jgi:LysM repeat protein
MVTRVSVISFLLAIFFSAPVLCSPEGEPPLLRDFPVPKTLNLCGEPMPLDVPHVWEMLDREITLSAWNPAQVFMWLKRSGRYFPFVEKRLSEMGLPQDLKYLAVAESALLTDARSRAGALGTWQFMPFTAQRNGLQKDGRVDERLDFERSTDAALQHLKDLKENFGAWTLAMAAYNSGRARVEKEIGIQRTRNYYKLYLPEETERYVFRIAAIKLILENPSQYGYGVPSDKMYKPLKYDAVQIALPKPVHIADVAEALNSDFKTLKELNPQILGEHLPSGSYTLRVPPGSGRTTAEFLGKASPTKGAPAETDGHYVVQAGDTLSSISRRLGVSVAELMGLNGLKGPAIRPGQKLRIKP